MGDFPEDFRVVSETTTVSKRHLKAMTPRFACEHTVARRALRGVELTEGELVTTTE